MVKSTDIFCSNDLYKCGVFEVYFLIFISINPIFFVFWYKMSWFLLTILYVESMEYNDVVYRSREKEIIKVRERRKQ